MSGCRGLLILCGWLCLLPTVGHAVEDEIQVYINDMGAPGQLSLELHSNFVAKGSRSPGYAGELPTDQVLQLTPELAYGLTRNLEAGMYFPPLAITSDGKVYENGLRLRLKFIADAAEGSQFFWGFNTEFGYATRRVSPSYWGMELRPIIGYQDQHWLWSFNPIVNLALEGEERTPEFEPALKGGYALAPGVLLGFEHYAGLGPVHRVSVQGAEQMSFLALDINRGKLDINFALGRGWSHTEDSKVVKMIVALPL